VIPEQLAVSAAETAFDSMDNLDDMRLTNLLRGELTRLIEVARLLM
jgi:hypothetical protein